LLREQDFMELGFVLRRSLESTLFNFGDGHAQIGVGLAEGAHGMLVQRRRDISHVGFSLFKSRPVILHDPRHCRRCEQCWQGNRECDQTTAKLACREQVHPKSLQKSAVMPRSRTSHAMPLISIDDMHRV